MHDLSHNPLSGELIAPHLIELRFHRLLERLPVGAYTCDTQGLITYFNPHAVEIWGRSPKLNDPQDRFCGSLKLFSSDGQPIPHDECWMALALQNGQEYYGEEVGIERPDGTRITVLAHTNPIRNDAGVILGAVNLLVDITDLKRGEDARALLAGIVASSDDAILSKSLVTGRILSWNQGAEKLLGYMAAEAIGAPNNLIVPSDKLEEEKDVVERLTRGERVEHFETVRVAKDGRRIDLSLSMSPIRDASGRVVAFSKVARDITTRKESDQALVALNAQLAAQVADLARLRDMSLRLATVTELQPILDVSLRTAAAIEGTGLGLLVLSDSQTGSLDIGASMGFDAAARQIIESTAPGGAINATCLEQRQRIVVFDIETDERFEACREAARQAGFRAVHSAPLITRGGELVGVLALYFREPHQPTDRAAHLIDLCARQAVDFIENSRLYSQLRTADQRKDEFLATLAHELRNPLAPISNSLHLLRMSGELSPAHERVREIMERQVNHLVRLVDDLLEVSRITRGKVTLRKEPISLAAVLRNAVETSQPLIDSAGHQLAISIAAEPLTIEADPVRLGQVFSNLLNNAAKYTPENGQIWLTARSENEQAVVSIRDTGVGIPPHMLARVFEMFAQGEQTLDLARGGLGIGLTLARRLVQMHDGIIEARSEGPGLGSEFIVRIPLAKAEAKPLRTELVISTHVSTPPPRRRILVVDDARASAFILATLLQTMGQEVDTAHDATAALEAVRTTLPDIVISDIAMPRIDGYELARRIRSEPGMQNVMLVALTGYGQDSDRQQAHNAGFDHHLVKPVKIEDLHLLLKSLRDALPRESASPQEA